MVTFRFQHPPRARNRLIRSFKFELVRLIRMLRVSQVIQLIRMAVLRGASPENLRETRGFRDRSGLREGFDRVNCFGGPRAFWT